MSLAAPYRIATVPFLNCLPLVEWFGTPEGASRGSLQADLPSRLAPLLADGGADAALLPTTEILRGCSAGIISGGGIACRGPVDSVKFYHRGPLSHLRLAHVDRGSRTSVALLKVLLAETEGVYPLFRELEPIPGTIPAPGEGVLVIGDRCFAFDRWLAGDPVAAEAISSLDLGASWLDHTGLPFVFAAWAAAPSLPAVAGPAGLREVAEILVAAREYGLRNLDALATREADRGNLGPGGLATASSLMRYFQRSLHYRLEDSDISGIIKFRDSCVALGLLDSVACLAVL